QGILISSSGEEIEITNNILVSENQPALMYFNTPNESFIVMNNVIWSSNANSVFQYDDIDIFNQQTDFQASNNVSFDPVFNDLLIAQNAEVVGLGSPLPIVLDILGNPRNAVTPTPGAYENIQTEPILGDLNGDGIVNTADLLALLGEFGCIGCTIGDIDGDGVVGMGDLLILLPLI
ncbi:MAG: hypothetical protein AAF193_03455, partial [Bacteroidota bacterium]